MPDVQTDRTVKNLILICGNEEYLKERKKDELLRELNAAGSINFNAFNDENLDLDEIERLAGTAPFLEDKRTLLISGSGLFKKEAQRSEGSDEAGKTGGIFADIPESTYVIFVENEVVPQNGLYKLVKKQGEIFNYETAESMRGTAKRENEADIRRWAVQVLKKEGLNIDSSTLNELIQLTGFDMMNLSNELEKLICYTCGRPKGSRISMQDIQDICSRTLSDRIFLMLDLKLKGKAGEAVKILEELFALKLSPMKILYMLVRQYNQALAVKECQLEGLGDAETMARTEVKDWQLRRIRDQIVGISAETLKLRLELCADTEFRIKSGNLSDRLGLELLMIQ